MFKLSCKYNNTECFVGCVGDVTIRLHGSDIVFFNQDRTKVLINLQGHNTLTTRRRINQILNNELNLPFRVNNRNFTPFLDDVQEIPAEGWVRVI